MMVESEIGGLGVHGSRQWLSNVVEQSRESQIERRLVDSVEHVHGVVPHVERVVPVLVTAAHARELGCRDFEEPVLEHQIEGSTCTRGAKGLGPLVSDAFRTDLSITRQ